MGLWRGGMKGDGGMPLRRVEVGHGEKGSQLEDILLRGRGRHVRSSGSGSGGVVYLYVYNKWHVAYMISLRVSGAPGKLSVPSSAPRVGFGSRLSGNQPPMFT